MIMSLLARVGGTLMGPAGYIALAVSLVISLHHNFTSRTEAREERIETAATNECNAGWLLAVSKRKQREAEAEALSVRGLIEGERRLNEELTDELNKLNAQHADLSAKLSSVGDGRCLSDGMLESLRRRGHVVPGAKGAEGGGSRNK